LAACAPPMTGAEYLTPAVLADLWRITDAAFDAERADARLSVQEFLKSRHPAWNLVGRVHFNLAENRKDDEAPFAFLATYTTRLSAHGKTQHVPLRQALEEYAGARNQDRLLSLLEPVRRAAASSSWLAEMVERGDVFHPLRWTPQDAFRLLRDATALEEAGVVLRLPAGWTAGRPPRARVVARVGGREPSSVGVGSLLDFDVGLTLDGEIYDFAQALIGQTEFAGACFDPDGQTLYVNQYGLRSASDTAPDLPAGPAGQGGITYAIYGPFEKRSGDRSRHL